jgi:hypothetical protein
MFDFPWPEVLRAVIRIIEVVLEIIGGGTLAYLGGRRLLYYHKEVIRKWQK